MSERLTKEQQKAVIAWMKRNKLVGQIWPVYRNSRLDVVLGALVPASFVVQELRAIGGGSGLVLTERQLNYLLKNHGIDPFPSGIGATGIEEKLIAKHRRIVSKVSI
jgi:hypothetical protein